MSDRRTVPPLRGAAPCLGGKRNLAARLIARIEAIDHETYAEPFVGMGGAFFRRRSLPTLEMINDRSRDVATFFRVLQRHYVAFHEMMRWQLTTRAEFGRLVATDPEMNGSQARRAFLLSPAHVFRRESPRPKLRRRAGQGRVVRRHAPRFRPRGAPRAPRRRGYRDEFIPRYDRAGFYCDPPYWGCESDYDKVMSDTGDVERHAEQLAQLRGSFILSLNDFRAVREIFGAFANERVATHTP